MDRRFNSENFERSLKTHTDDFKLMPSKKVWHGIYNDLHPGTRWPSVAMSLVFIFTLVIIGHLNTNNSKIIAAINPPAKSVAPLNAGKKKSRNHTVQLPNNNLTANNSDINILAANTVPSASPDQNLLLPLHLNNYSPDVNSDPSENKGTGINPVNSFVASNTSASTKKDNDAVVKNEDNTTNGNTVINSSNTSSINKEDIEENPIEISGNSILPGSDKTVENKKEIILAAGKKGTDEKQPIKNKPKDSPVKPEEKTGSSFLTLSKKVRDKITINYYVTPSLNYRNLSERKISSTANQNNTPAASAGFTNTTTNNVIINKPVIGLELGSAINYKLSKRWQVIAGLQFDYAGYNIKANNVHPVSTSLLLISDFTGEPYAFNSMSYFGNASSSSYTTLHQYSLQASAPLGFKYMISEKNNLQFNIEATLQPSYVIASKAYLLSYDKKNYVIEPSLVRSLNMSTNVGTFVSFKSNNFKWQIGPQVFYQMFSTYSHNYPTQEHLINYGIRFGVSKLKN